MLAKTWLITGASRGFGRAWATAALERDDVVAATVRNRADADSLVDRFGDRVLPGIGLYHASKWALEGFSQSLAQEVAGFGIHVTLIEPGGFSTDWSGPSAKRSEPLPAYAELHEQVAEMRKQRSGFAGDPQASAAAVLAIVDAEEPPLRAFLGAAPLSIAKADYEKRLASWEEWQPNAVMAQG